MLQCKRYELDTSSISNDSKGNENISVRSVYRRVIRTFHRGGHIDDNSVSCSFL